MLTTHNDPDCYHCRHHRRVPWNAHIQCEKPDPEMTGNAHGVRSGWFFYPYLFDPIWKTKHCSTYEENNAPPDIR